MKSSLPRLLSRLALLVPALLLAVSLLAACGGGRSGVEKAGDAVAKGLIAQRAGNLDAAETLYREALNHDSQNKFALYNLGLVRQTRGDLAQAENLYRVAMALDPAFTSPIYNLAVIRRDAGSLGESAELWRLVTATEPNNVGARYNLGLVLKSLGREAEGELELQIARQLDPTFGAPTTPPPNTIP